ncbi:MAG TPA: 23S rRNA (pseudouridine(1915)-N(3))-methyltransferase RlmH [Candidatus Saccharimonadales bacterium]|nr:23S rRNA (pseudouridine(1915)-N(3))-methyltransferase RlmH [Candidatus Saccharimonadales bacterium]
MKLHLITVGEPKLAYAKAGWDEYLKRLKHYHSLRITHIADKYAYDAGHLLDAAGSAYKVALVIDGKQYTSPELSGFLDKRALDGREICFIIGGPEGLPQGVIGQSDLQWGLSRLTFPHDLAMVVLLEALYRASTISAGIPYHK